MSNDRMASKEAAMYFSQLYSGIINESAVNVVLLLYQLRWYLFVCFSVFVGYDIAFFHFVDGDFPKQAFPDKGEKVFSGCGVTYAKAVLDFFHGHHCTGIYFIHSKNLYLSVIKSLHTR